MGRNLVALAVLAGSFASIFGQTEEIPSFRAETQLALTGFHVVKGTQYVTGLSASDFQLLVDGRPHAMASFEEGGRLNAPLEIVLVFDTSGSVREPGLLDEKLFRDNLLAGLPNVSLSIYRFGGHPLADHLTRVCGPTKDPAALRKAFQTAFSRGPGEAAFDLGHPGKDSLVYEAITEAINDRARDSQRVARMMLVVSDGLPGVEPNPGMAVGAALRMGIPIYPLLLGHRDRVTTFNMQLVAPPDPGESAKIAEARARYRQKTFDERESQAGLFVGVASQTGGRAFDPPELNAATAKDILGFLVGEVRKEYVVGFSPEPGREASNHRIDIRLIGNNGARIIGGKRFARY